MLYPDHEIISAAQAGIIGIHPFHPALVQPASLDVRLGHEFRTIHPDTHTIDPREPTPTTLHTTAPGEPFTLPPGGFALAHTLETITLPSHIAARFEGKSSLGRLGLAAHVTAGFIDPGFHGQITLELHNVAGHPIRLHPGDPIGQICFIPLTSPAEHPYGTPGLGSHYQNQTGPTPSRAWQTPPRQGPRPADTHPL